MAYLPILAVIILQLIIAKYERSFNLSVTIFGKISPHCQKFKSLWTIFWMSYLAFGKRLSQLWHFMLLSKMTLLLIAKD